MTLAAVRSKAVVLLLLSHCLLLLPLFVGGFVFVPYDAVFSVPYIFEINYSCLGGES